MAKIIIKSILVVFFVSGQPLPAQKDFINPFKIGNYYEYRFEEQFNYRYKAKITKDTIIDGQKFFVLNIYDEPGMGNYSQFFRLDTNTLRIYRPGTNSCSDSTGYNLEGGFNMPLGYTWNTCHANLRSKIIDTATYSNVFNSGIPLQFFARHDTIGGLGKAYSFTYYGEMFGFYSSYRSSGSPFGGGEYTKVLKGAIIDGVEYGEILLEINQISNEIPSGFALEQNFPNPFNPSTVIQFAIPKKQNLKISVFNSLGQEINVLVNEVKDAGKYQYIFNGKNLSSGIYFYRLETKDFSETKRMVLVK
jgi:hypothetical protein